MGRQALGVGEGLGWRGVEPVDLAGVDLQDAQGKAELREVGAGDLGEIVLGAAPDPAGAGPLGVGVDALAGAVRERRGLLRAPRGPVDPVADLAGRCDLVFVDAPCTGAGAWRRSPDAKWRIRPGALAERIKDQNQILERAAKYVKPGGRLVYVTCSLLMEENEDRLAAFLAGADGFAAISAASVAICESISE